MIETEEQYLKRMTQNAVKEEKERFADWLKLFVKKLAKIDVYSNESEIHSHLWHLSKETEAKIKELRSEEK